MAGNYDGKVTISTELDNSGIEKDFKKVSGELGGLEKILNKFSKAISGSMSRPVNEACTRIQKDISAVEKSIKQYQQQIQKAETAKMPLVEQAEQLGVELDTAKAKLAELQAQQQVTGNILSAAGEKEMSGAGLQAYLDAYEQKPQLDAAVLQQQAQVDALQRKWDAVNDKVDTYNAKIYQANREMAEQKSIAAELAKELDSAEKETKNMRKDVSGTKKGLSSMSKAVESFASRLKRIALGALLFNGISAGLREFTSYLGKTLKTNEAFTTELSRLKGALLTAFQPIYNVVTPAVTYLMQMLTAATLVVAEFFASLTGTTVAASAEAAKGLYEEVNALEEVGKTAKKASKSFAGFDEVNVLQQNTATSSADDSSTSPTFNWDTTNLQQAKQWVQEIVGYLPAIAAGFAGIKLGGFLSDLFTANIEAKTLGETISLLGKKAGLTVGITLAVTGIALEVKGISEAVQEGLNGINFTEIVGGGGMLVGGGALIGNFFGKVIIGGAVGAIVAGVGTVFAGIYDACVNGIDWLSAALTAIGTTAIGAGIGALIGSVGGPLGALIGLGVGLVIDGIIYLVQVIVDNWESISAWFSEVFAAIGQWLADLWQGIVDIWNVCAEWFNTNVIQPLAGFFSGLWEGVSTVASDCWNAIVEFFTPAVEWFSQLFGSIWQTISDIFYNIGVIASGCWEIIKAVWVIVSEWFDVNVIQPVAGFFSDLWTGISNWAIEAWENIKAVFSTIGNWINTNIIQPVSNFFSGLWNGFVEKARTAWEGVKNVFGKVATFFSDIFKKAWQGIVNVFSVAGEIFVEIKDGIVNAFKFVVNGIIKGLNSVLAIPFNGINSALNWIKGIEIVGIKPFGDLKTITVPQIPYLAQGAVIPPNREFMAVLGDQRHGTNIEAPLDTIKQALAEVMATQNGGDVTINFTGDLAQLARVLKPVIDRENRRVGGSLIKEVAFG